MPLATPEAPKVPHVFSEGFREPQTLAILQEVSESFKDPQKVSANFRKSLRLVVSLANLIAQESPEGTLSEHVTCHENALQSQVA